MVMDWTWERPKEKRQKGRGSKYKLNKTKEGPKFWPFGFHSTRTSTMRLQFSIFVYVQSNQIYPFSQALLTFKSCVTQAPFVITQTGASAGILQLLISASSEMMIITAAALSPYFLENWQGKMDFSQVQFCLLPFFQTPSPPQHYRTRWTKRCQICCKSFVFL